jgi:hypothetical protein
LHLLTFQMSSSTRAFVDMLHDRRNNVSSVVILIAM